VSGGEKEPYEYISTNIEGTKVLADVCDKFGAKLIHFSSSSVYGGSDKKLKEEDKKEPRSIYGITKLASEGIVRMMKDWIIIRPFTVIGEDGRPELVINKWLNQYRAGEKISFYGKGDTYRGYTYVGDLIDGVLKANKFNRKDFNLGGNQKITLKQLWKIFKKIHPDAKREVLPLPSYDIPGSIADISKADILLDWQPKTDLKKKIKELWIYQ
jgi:UDP-glucuronate 4-epimerase